MPFLDAIRLALAQIRVQKLKSFFTLLGVTIGVMFLIAVVSIVEGMSSYMEHDFVGKLVGVNTVSLRHIPEIGEDMSEAEWREMQRRPRILITDVEPVVASLPPGTLWSAEGYDNVSMSSQWAKPTMLQASAVEGDYFKIREMKVERGRVITIQEMALGTPVIVVGQEIASRFFPNLDPLNRQLKVAGLPYTVIGVAESQGSIFGLSLDRFVIAPYRSPLRHVVNRPLVIDALKIKVAGDADMTETIETIRQVMRGRRALRPAQPDNFALETSESALTFWTGIKSKLVIAGVILPAIGLIVGAIVIMNIMLVAVAERTREIGIRKALGARRRDIMSQFLVEAATLSTVGAIFGIVIGISLAQVIAAVSPLPATVAPWSIIAGVFVGAGVGIISGIYPASRASKLDPILALRQE
ncbi:MAG: ABC transporter permease [Gemmatimonadaceae bacterium]|nr:ABC transporter permease [Gemmatimonadaceae bacterium]MDQ3244240.1 ABC transporter permease [Gemmatimonadota bacterium]